MSAPRTKRPFAGAAADPSQRQITAFFAAADAAAAEPAEPPPSARQPLIPSSVQANLLSVGMRVRKSVPEGYKTAGTSAFKLWTDSAAPTPAPGAGARAAAAARARELLPFCGINKVGGLGTQQDRRVDDDDNDDDDDDDGRLVPGLGAVPELTMSQESVDSPAPEASRKRAFDDSDAAADVPTAWVQPDSRFWEDQVSPRSFVPANWGNARAKATPRSRTRTSTPLKDVGQENMAVEGDFEEADFLVVGDAREMDTSL